MYDRLINFMQLFLGPALVCLLITLPTVSEAAANPVLEKQFTQTVLPFLDKHCTGCHSGDKPAAQFDLRPYTNMDTVVKDHPRWALILERLHAKEMPPKPLPQPPDASRKQVMDWIDAVRAEEARRNAGDPGPVLARRLSNAEYNYTIRDLTGADIRPTREFPVDPANQAGFDNTGESLTMSPALLNKYMQAAREVGDHMVLTPDGFDFAPHPMLVETDREKYAIKGIVDFYFSQPTDYAGYFEAAWRYKHRAALGKPATTLATLAGEAKLSAKFLPMVWQLLEGPATQPGKAEVGPMAKLRTLWKALPAPLAPFATDRTPKTLPAKCVAMRDWVVKLRKITAREFVGPVVRGLSPASQPLMNWKFKQFAANRRDFDRAAFRLASEPEPAVPAIPRYPGLGQEGAFRAAALMKKARAGNADIVIPEGVERADFEAAFARFSNVFPDVFFVSERGRFFPDDSDDKGRLLSAGYHNVMGYYRDDTPLRELILDDAGVKRLQRLWDEFDFIGDHTNRTWDQYYFNQSGEILGTGRESGSPRPPDKAVNSTAVIYALRESYIAKAQALPTNTPASVEAIQEHFKRVDDTLRGVEKMRKDSEPLHVDALVRFAARAYRRPLTKAEGDDLRAFYRTLRDKGALTHEEAIRDSVVSVLMAPDFCYRFDLSGAAAKGAKVAPLDNYALASRLSYFLWSSMPDDELIKQAAAGTLRNPAALLAQTRRMLKDGRARGLATEFAGNWLDFRRFDQHNSVDRTRFPAFTNELRQAMFEEPVRLIEDAIHNDRSVLDLIYGNYTFVNPVLAKQYGVPDVTGKADRWVRVDNAVTYGRGGLLPMAAFLTQNSPGLRTSPVKRGYWVVRRVLGETIPPPPPNVPELPDDEAKANLPLRDMLAKHRENAACASCHARFDAFGLSFEGYGPVGDARTVDLAGRPVDTTAEFPGGMKAAGVEGVRTYIREHREKDYLDNLSRKMLTYALGHSLMLSDEPVVQRMKARLAASGNRFSSLVEPVVTSPQFLNRRN